MTEPTNADAATPRRFIKETKGHIPGRIVVEAFVNDACVHSEAVVAADLDAARNRARAAIRPVTLQ